MSIGPGAESVTVELFASTTVDSRWDRALWDAQRWDAPAWQGVGCEVLEATYQTGSSSEAGVLSVPDAGALDLRTYDPDRLLDPLSTASPFLGSIRPGTPIRLLGSPGPIAAWTGYLDEARFELASSSGRLRAVDGIAYLAQAELAEGVALPNTLRARVRAIVAAVGLGSTVPVQPEVMQGEFLVNGSFETLDDPNAAYPYPVSWLAYPDAAGIYAATSPNTVDGTRVADIQNFDGTERVLYQIATGLVPGQPYTASVWACRANGSANGQVLILDPDGGVLAGGPVTNGPPMVGYSFPFTCPPNGKAQVNLYTAAAGGTGTGWQFDRASILGPTATVLVDDPPVAAHDGKSRSAWAIIQDAALDALTYVWLDPTGTLRFTPWGSLPDANYSVGCDDGTGGAWLAGLSSLESTAAADAIRNSVRSWASADTFGAPLKDDTSIRLYGERRLDVPRIVPNAATWAQRVLGDRAGAGLEVALGELRPYTPAELALLLAGAQAGPSVLRVRDDDHGELVDLDVAVIGAAVGVTANGWRFRQVTAIPRGEWDQAQQPPPVIPPTPPPDAYHTETRTYIATSDALLALTSGGAKYGAGASSTLPVGAWQGWTYRALIQLPAIPWTKVRRIVSATLILRTTTAVRVGFGSSPTIELRRITGAWSAGSSSSPGSGNAVVWPGPATAGSVRSNVTAAQSTTARIRVDSLVLPWAPTSVGGTLAAQRGLALYPGSGSQSDTTEFWPVEKGGSDRPTLELVLEVFD